MKAPSLALPAILALGSVLPDAGWSQVLPPGCPHAVGIHLAAASYESVLTPTGQEEVSFGRSAGARVSYGRRILGGRRLWLAPEVAGGWVGESSLSTSNAANPAGVGRSFAAALMRANFYPAANEPPSELFSRLGLGVGVGLAYGRFAESERLVDGSANPGPRKDGAFGPAVAFGMDLQITRHMILRADFHLLFLEPELSFPWPDRTADKIVGGGGLVVVF